MSNNNNGPVLKIQGYYQSFARTDINNQSYVEMTFLWADKDLKPTGIDGAWWHEAGEQMHESVYVVPIKVKSRLTTKFGGLF